MAKEKFHRITLVELTTGFVIYALLSLISMPIINFIHGYGNSLNMGIYMILIFLAGTGLISVPKSFEKFIIFFLLAILTTGGTVFYVFKTGALIQDYAMRLKVDRTGGIEQLQTWANDIFEKPEEDIFINPNTPYIKKELLSEQVKDISNYDVVYLHSEPQGKYLRIRVGGGGFIQHSWGIIITSPNTRIEDVYEYGYIKWQDGVYAY
jgi:hypothetical protein